MGGLTNVGLAEPVRIYSNVEGGRESPVDVNGLNLGRHKRFNQIASKKSIYLLRIKYLFRYFAPALRNLCREM